jgi:CRISPR-associated exonuclease Cas4
VDHWFPVAALVLGSVACWLFLRARAVRRDAGLPAGRVTYVDTGGWAQNEQPLFSREYLLTGKPDYLVNTRRGVIPVEVKSGRAPREPYASHVLQLAAYCLLVEEQEGASPPYGIIKYEDTAFEVDYTASLRSQLLEEMGAIRRDLRARKVHRSHEESRRCRGCGYRQDCGEALVE